MKEIWKDIKEYEGLYQVSNLGRVKSLKRIEKFYHNNNDKILIQSKCSNGYLKIVLSKNNLHKNYMTHRLVAKTFLPNPENKRTVNHKDGNKQNNCVDNLEWATYSENIQHAYNLGLNYGSDKLKGRAGKLSKMSKSVYQIDRNKNKILNEYYSVREAERQTKIKAQSICNCCNNKKSCKTAGGYKWCYVQDYNTNYNK